MPERSALQARAASAGRRDRREGDFAAGDAVMVLGEDGVELAKGLVSYAKKDLERAKASRAAGWRRFSPRRLRRSFTGTTWCLSVKGAGRNHLWGQEES